MTTNYPGSVDSLPNTYVDGTAQATVHPAHHNNIATAVMAIETDLVAGIGIASTSVATSETGQIYVYRTNTGAYNAVNALTGRVVATHATDYASVFDTVLALLPGDATTANSARAGGVWHHGPHIFNTTRPLKIIGKRSVKFTGSGTLQQTIFQQNANYAAGEATIQIGASADTTILQGMELSHFQVRGNRGSYTNGGGIKAYCGWSQFHDIIIQDTSDDGFYLNGTSTVTCFEYFVERVWAVGFGRSAVNTAHGFNIDTNTSDGDVLLCYAHQYAEGDNFGANGFQLNGGTCRVNHCHAYFCRINGFNTTTGGTLEFNFCIGESNGQKGISVDGASGVQIAGGGYYSNGQNVASPNMYLNNIQRFTISGIDMNKKRGGTTNVPRNLHVLGCTTGNIHDMTFADADTDHVLIENCTDVDLHDCQFTTGITYSPTPNGSTPSVAIRLSGSSNNCQVYGHTIAGTMGIEEFVTSWTGNYNRFYNNIVGAAVTLQDGTTFTSRAHDNRDRTGGLWPDRHTGGKGADAASANDMSLLHGLFFDITGAVQINGIRTAGWDPGVVFTLQTDSNPTIKNNTAPGAGFAKIMTKTAADVVMATGKVMRLTYDGTQFWEV